MDINEIQTLARRVAGKVSGEWPGIDRDDIEQEIMVKVLASPDSLEGLTEAQLFKTFAKVGNSYASSERYAYTFHSGQYVYTPAEVRALLEAAFNDAEAWESVPRKEDYRLNAASGGVIIGLWDLQDAFTKLAPASQDVLRKRFTSDESLSDSERKAANRAVDTMVVNLNRRVVATERSRETHEGLGSRTAMSNAAAQAATRESY